MIKIKIDKPAPLATIKIDDLVNVTVNRDYLDLKNKPAINDVELVGNKSFQELGMGRITNTEIQDIIGGIG